MAVACLEVVVVARRSYRVEGSAQSWAGFQNSGANEEIEVTLLDQS